MSQLLDGRLSSLIKGEAPPGEIYGAGAPGCLVSQATVRLLRPRCSSKTERGSERTKACLWSRLCRRCSAAGCKSVCRFATTAAILRLREIWTVDLAWRAGRIPRAISGLIAGTRGHGDIAKRFYWSALPSWGSSKQLKTKNKKKVSLFLVNLKLIMSLNLNRSSMS